MSTMSKIYFNIKILAVGSALTFGSTFCMPKVAQENLDIFLEQIQANKTMPAEYSGAQWRDSRFFNTYMNLDHGIRIGYPKDWNKVENILDGVVLFMVPQESASNDFRENFNIFIDDLSTQPMTLEEYTAFSLKKLEQITSDSDVNSIENSLTMLGGRVASKYIYTMMFGAYRLKFLQVYTVKNMSAYVLTYTAKEDTFDTFLPMAQQMIQSFDFIASNDW